jgi:transposase InsO family protein
VRVSAGIESVDVFTSHALNGLVSHGDALDEGIFMESYEQARETIYKELTSDDAEVRSECLNLFGTELNAFSDAMAHAVLEWRLKIYDVCNQKSAVSFVDEVIRRLPFRVLVIQTDSGAEFQSNFHWHLEERDIRHVYIRPRTPRLNGKVERSHRVDEQEFYQLLDKDGIGDDIHLFNDKLQEWEDYYNYHRPHGALDGQTPYERLLARKASAKVLPKS